ncbi:MAG: multicopper oxidase family protein [Gammaproteobacteria bacterium]
MKIEMNEGRRSFLKSSSLGLASSAFPSLLFAQPGGIGSRPTPNFKPDVEVELTARKSYLPILKGRNTAIFTYEGRLIEGPEDTVKNIPGSYLGPIFNFVHGQKVRIYFYNKLPEPTIVHWHGLHVPQKMDGHPMYGISTGQRYVFEFEIKNRAGTSFYHSHTHELTAEQVYKGLAGLIVVTDRHEQALELPRGEFDLPIVIQDRRFTQNNQLSYVGNMHERMMGFLGDEILVNGKKSGVIPVKAGVYRLRMLNGSNSRIYKLGWDDGTPLTAIGTDAGLLEKPATRPYIMLAPGERVDLWADFSGRETGSEVVMRSLPFSGAMPPMYERMQGGMGRMGGHGGMGMMSASSLKQGAGFDIVKFRIGGKSADAMTLPSRLVPFERLKESEAANPDSPVPIAISMGPMAPKLNGKSFSLNRVMDFEKVPVDTIQKIRIFHSQAGGMGMGMRGGMMGGRGGMGMMMSMAHPIHMHGQQFQILSRTFDGNRADEYATVKEGFIDNGWKDTVLVMPGEEITVLKPFQHYKGLFLYHCHNLEHEDLGMMRNFYVG